jgi:XRE family transcriptional regulator, regulator of sulfur utilization
MSQFAESLKKLRVDQDLSMQLLAEKAGVSKSMISKIERDEVQPTLDVAARLAKALGKTLSELLHTATATQIAFLPRHEQAVWEDASGIKRRNISPVFEGLKIEWLEVLLPAGACIVKCVSISSIGDIKYVLVKKGELKMLVSGQSFLLKEGDSIYFDSSFSHEFHNETKEAVEFYVVMKHPN